MSTTTAPKAAVKTLVTGAQLKKICTTLPLARAAIIADLINEIAPGYGMDTLDELHEFIAQVAHESGEFSRKDENLNYSVQGLMDTFSYYRAHPELAKKHGRIDGKQKADQQAIANTAYADKNRPPERKLGNTQEGDGWRFRGRAFLQITGRELYTKYAQYKKADLNTVIANIGTSDRWAMDVSLWVFCVEKKLLDDAERDDFIAITKAISGALTNLPDRKKYYELAKAVLK